MSNDIYIGVIGEEFVTAYTVTGSYWSVKRCIQHEKGDQGVASSTRSGKIVQSTSDTPVINGYVLSIKFHYLIEQKVPVVLCAKLFAYGYCKICLIKFYLQVTDFMRL